MLKIARTAAAIGQRLLVPAVCLIAIAVTFVGPETLAQWCPNGNCPLPGRGYSGYTAGPRAGFNLGFGFGFGFGQPTYNRYRAPRTYRYLPAAPQYISVGAPIVTYRTISESYSSDCDSCGTYSSSCAASRAYSDSCAASRVYSDSCAASRVYSDSCASSAPTRAYRQVRRTTRLPAPVD